MASTEVTITKKNPNWRAENLRKANEARRLKIEARKLAEAETGLAVIDKAIDAKLEIEVDKRVTTLLESSDVRGLKLEFYSVFKEVGGVRGMVDWIKNNARNRLEYYKLLISLLKSESQKQQVSQKQGVIVNIIQPGGEPQTLLSTETIEADDGREEYNN